MATVSQFVRPCTVSKAFYAHLYDEPGILCKVDKVIYFMVPETGTITEFEPSMTNFCTVLGDAAIADTQKIMDTIHGGHAAIACGRGN